MGDIGPIRLGVFVLLTLACHGPLSPFLPATFEPILLLYGQLYPPLLVALIGALVSVAAEYPDYYLYRALLRSDTADRLMQGAAPRAVAAVFARRPFLAIWVCAWSPLPDWAARVLAAHARYPVRRYLLAFLAGRIPKFWLLAAVGRYWLPSGPVMWAVLAGSVACTVCGLRRKGAAMRSMPAPLGEQQPQPGTELPPRRRRGEGQPCVPAVLVAPPCLPPALVLRLTPSSPGRALSRNCLLGIVSRLPHGILRVLRHRSLEEAPCLTRK
jgi:uncharacterized membrane protein YdjX (TVP38/TMEM64 family)